MRLDRRHIVVLLFIIAELVSTFYIFNYTYRERHATFAYKCPEEVVHFSISNWGSSITVAGDGGTLFFYSGGMKSPDQWYYNEHKIVSVDSSIQGDYAAMLDENGKISLFSSIGSGLNPPKWTHSIQNATLAEIYVTGGLPALVYILVNENGKILLFSNRDDLVWVYETGQPYVESSFSYNGKHIVAVDEGGNLYVFEVRNPEPIWRRQTDLVEVKLDLSHDTIAVAGKKGDGGGVRVYSMNDGEELHSWSGDSPIISISISSDGSLVLSRDERGEALLLETKNFILKERPFEMRGVIKDVRLSSFGSYAFVLNSKGTVFFYFIPRTVPLWKYPSRTGASRVAVTSFGDKIFIAEGKEIAVVSNSYHTGLIPGSRYLWGLVFFSSLLGLVLISLWIRGKPRWLNSIVDSKSKLFLGLSAGFLMGLIQGGGIPVFFVGVVSSAMGCYYAYNRASINGLIFSFSMAVAGSLVTGFLYGLCLWFSGFEGNIMVTTLTSVSSGFQIGVINAAIGVLLAEIAKRTGSF